jgi:tight adherence protein C
MLLLIAIGTFATIALLAIGLTMKSERVIVQERMQTHAHTGEPEGSVELEMGQPFGQRVVLPFFRKLSSIGRLLTPGGATRAIDEKLETAGRPWNLGVAEFMGLKALSIVLGVVVGFIAAGLINASPLMSLFFFALIVFIGIILPDYLLQRAINERQAAIRRALADTLDLLTVSVEAGLGLDGAMQKVTERFHNPLAHELDRALGEMRVGKLRADALRSMAARVKVQELSSFVAAICQADQLGVSIANVLRVQGETLRTQRSQRARETAAKLPVKMLIPLVFCIFPAIFVVVLAPGVIQIVKAFRMIQ